MQPLDIGVSAVSAGTTQAFGGQIVFSDSNNISFGINGHTVTASVAAGGITCVSGLGVSTGGNTSGTTGTVVGTVVLAGINNITLSQATSPGPNATITISGRDAIFGAGVSTGGNTSGTTGTVTGTLVLAGLGEIFLSQSTNASGVTITISAASDSAASVVSAFGVSTGGNTAGNTGTTNGTIVLAGIGNITLSQSTAAGSQATISISGSQSTAPAAIAAGTQTGTSGTIVFSNSNNVSFGMSGSTRITASASFSQTVQPGVTAIGVSTGGNTSGNTGTTQGTYILAGGNQITLSQSTAAGSLATVTISGRDAIFGAGVSTGGNTSGTTGTVTGTLVFAGLGNITLSQSTNASGATITASVGTAATGGIQAIAAGTQTATSGTVVFSNNNVMIFAMSNSSVVTARPTFMRMFQLMGA